MAVTVVKKETGNHFERYEITITADGSATLVLPDRCIRGIAIASDGTDGGGTLTAFASPDGTTFAALSGSTPAAPRTDHTLSETAAGAWVLALENLAHRALKFTLASSTNPTLVISVTVMF